MGTEKEQEQIPEEQPQRSPASDVESWLANWPAQRAVIEELIRERAGRDPSYSWLAAMRRVQMMTRSVQSMNSLLKELTIF